MTKSKNQPARKAFRRPHLFGPPPILEGEEADAYNEILDRVFDAIAPTDFLEEIWVRDLVDVTWTMIRWRRLLAVLLSEEVSEKVNDEAVSLAEAKTELMEGPEKEEMEALLDDSDPEYDWDTQVSKYPRANKKFQELWSAAKSTLNIDLIQGRVLKHNLDMIERINDLIIIAQRRIDEVMRELDRHRFMRAQLNSLQDRQESKLTTGRPKLIEGKALNKEVA